jgi:hypothetical protein
VEAARWVSACVRCDCLQDGDVLLLREIAVAGGKKSCFPWSVTPFGGILAARVAIARIEL